LVILMVYGWRDAIKGSTRRMVENATLSIASNGTRLISPPSPPTPKPSAEELALRAERDDEERQRDIFFNQMDWITSDFGRTFWTIDAEELIKNPGQAGFAYDMGSFPNGGKRTIGTRVSMDVNHIDETYQIARIDLARKLLAAGGTHGANYNCGGEISGNLNSLWMTAVPIVLDHGM